MEPIEEGNFYHLYNRGANKSTLFWTNQDFRKFMELYRFYLYPAVETYSWCLMQNHFHFLVKIRTKNEQAELYRREYHQFQKGVFHGKLNPAERPYNASRQLSHFMNRYTRFINCKKRRSGTLIQGPINRKLINDDAYFINLICYIHSNPIHHGINNHHGVYPYSSYNDLIGIHPTFLERDKVLDLFGTVNNFLTAHQEFIYNLDFAENLRFD
jgi:putative transposase